MTNQDLWAQRVAEWRASGVTPHRFCQDRDYSHSSLYYWIRKLDGPLVPKHEFVRVVARSRAAVEVVRPDEPSAAERAEPDSIPSSPAPTPMLVETGGVRIFVEGTGQRAALAMVLDVLTSGS